MKLEKKTPDEAKVAAWAAVVALKGLLSLIGPEERVQIIREVGEGYCQHCGTAVFSIRCQCWNDE